MSYGALFIFDTTRYIFSKLLMTNRLIRSESDLADKSQRTEDISIITRSCLFLSVTMLNFSFIGHSDPEVSSVVLKALRKFKSFLLEDLPDAFRLIITMLNDDRAAVIKYPGTRSELTIE